MQCEQVKELLPKGPLGLSRGTRWGVLSHLHKCPECRKIADEMVSSEPLSVVDHIIAFVEDISDPEIREIIKSRK